MCTTQFTGIILKIYSSLKALKSADSLRCYQFRCSETPSLTIIKKKKNEVCNKHLNS